MNDDIAGMTFEAAMAELEAVVKALESGNVALEKSLELYDRGAMLKAHCDAKLKAAEEKVELIRARDGQAVGTQTAEGF